MKLAGEQLEYAISQYVDGTLSDLDRRVLDEQLRTDADARSLVEDYRKLTVVLQAHDPMPSVDFDTFSAGVLSSLDRESWRATAPIALWRGPLQRMAVAAGVMLAALLAYQLLPHPATRAPQQTRSIQIKGPMTEIAAAAPSTVVNIGPSDELAKRGETASLDPNTLVPPTPRVVISAVDLPFKSDVRPY